MKFQNLSVKRLFGRVAIGLALSMSGITIALFFVTKQTAVLLTGGVLLLCALVGIFVLTQAFGTRLSQFTADLCQTLDHMIAGNEAPQRPEDSETQLARIGHRLARLYQIILSSQKRRQSHRNGGYCRDCSSGYVRLCTLITRASSPPLKRFAPKRKLSKESLSV